VHILITGLPGTGKTTLIKKVAARLPDAVGFYTEEIRERGVRKGFRLVSLGPGILSGKESVLSHVDMKSPHRVGKYRVDVEGFEKFLDRIPLEGASTVVIDEIGRMECLSAVFRTMITELLRAPEKTVVATVALKGTPFIEGLKKTPGARIFEVTKKNRDDLAGEAASLLKPTVPTLE
jgi:nucleoside-triphosphatase